MCQASDDKKRKSGVALVEFAEPLQFDQEGALKKTLAYKASVIGIVIGKRIELLKGMKTIGGLVKKNSKGMLTAFNEANGELIVDFGDGVGVEIPLFCVKKCADAEEESPPYIASAGSKKKVVPAVSASSADAGKAVPPAGKKCRLHGIIADVHFIVR
jgi:hypothetical protein